MSAIYSAGIAPTHRFGLALAQARYGTVAAVALAAFCAIKITLIVARGLCTRLVSYGATHGNEKIVTIFSRCISDNHLKCVARSIIEQKNDFALSNLLKFSPPTSWFFEVAFEKPEDMIMCCKIIKYSLENKLVAVEKICEFINLLIGKGAKFYSFANEALFVSDIFNAAGTKDINESVSAWQTALLCIAAAENNLALARDLIARGANTDKRRYHHEYNTQLYPFEFAAEYYHFEMVELLLGENLRLDGYACKPTDLIAKLVQERRFELLEKFISKGVKLQLAGALLYDAVKSGRESVVQKLVDAGAVPTLMDVEVAKALGYWNTHDILLRKLVQIDSTLLATSMQSNDAWMVFRLIGCGAQVPENEEFINKSIDLLLYGIDLPKLNDQQLVELVRVVVSLSRRTLIQDEGVVSFLTNSRRVFNLLPQCDVLSSPLYKDGYSLMHWLAMRGRADIMRPLVEIGAKLDFQLEYFRTTPLHCAVHAGHHECVKILLTASPALVQITALSTIQLLDGRIGVLEETPFDVVLRLERMPTTVVILANMEDPTPLLEPLHKAYLQNQPSEFSTFLFQQMRKQLIRSAPAQNNLRSLVLACENFNNSSEIGPALIKHLAEHTPFIPYFETAGYDCTFVVKGRQVLVNTLHVRRIQEHFERYGTTLAARLRENPEGRSQEASQFIEASFAFRRMHPIFGLKSPAFIVPLIETIKHILQQHSLSKTRSDKSPETEFDEQDGSILVGQIFTAMNRKDVTQYCRDAFEMGLLEGRDFRALGIQNGAIEIKQALLKRLQEKGALSRVPPLTPEQGVSQWGFTFNIELLKWVLSKKAKVIHILGEHKVSCVSELKDVDLIALLL